MKSVRLSGTGTGYLGTTVLCGDHRAYGYAVEQHRITPRYPVLKIGPGNTTAVKVETERRTVGPIKASVQVASGQQGWILVGPNISGLTKDSRRPNNAPHDKEEVERLDARLNRFSFNLLR